MKEKRRLWKIWNNGGSKEDYVLAKKVAKLMMFATKKKVGKKKMKNIETDTHTIYCIAKKSHTCEESGAHSEFLFGIY